MLRNMLIILCLFSFSRAHAYKCSASDTINTTLLTQLSKSRLYSQFNEKQRDIFSDNYQALLFCPAQNLNNPQLNEKEKNNLKSILIEEQIQGFENYIADNMRFVNLNDELESYIRVHEAVYGKDKSLPSGIQQIIKNKEAYKEDLKKNCSDAKVDTTHMGPVRNQQDVGWCYAYSSADLISFHAKKTVSAIDVAILFNNYSPTAFKHRLLIADTLNSYDFFRPQMEALGYTALPKAEIQKTIYDSQYEGGQEDEALNIALEKGVCSETDLPSSDVNPDTSLKTKKESAIYYKDKIEPVANSCTGHTPALQSLFTRLNVQAIDDVITKATPDRVLLGLRNANCLKPVKLRNKRVVTMSKPKYSNMFSALDAQLNKSQPVVVGYKFNMIEKGESGAHSSIIVGRRFNEKTNKCEYRVRNSWGAHNHYEVSTGIKHEDGYYWVDEKSLKKNIIDINFLD